MRRAFLLGLRQRGRPMQLARQVSNPASPHYRRFVSTREYRRRFAPAETDRRRVRRFLADRPGVERVQVSSDRSLFLAVLTPGAGKRLFCAKGIGPVASGLCIPPPLRGRVRQISAGELYELGAPSSRAPAAPAHTPRPQRDAARVQRGDRHRRIYPGPALDGVSRRPPPRARS